MYYFNLWQDHEVFVSLHLAKLHGGDGGSCTHVWLHKIKTSTGIFLLMIRSERWKRKNPQRPTPIRWFWQLH